MTNILEAAQFNALAYFVTDLDETGAPVFASNTPSDLTALPFGWRVLEIHDDPGGFHAVTFISDANEIYIAARGNDNFGNIIGPDVDVFFGNAPDQYNIPALDYYESLHQDPQFANYTILGGGHSLGGEVMAFVSSQTGMYALTENAPNTVGTTGEGAFGDSHVFQIVQQNDVVGHWGPPYSNVITVDTGAVVANQFGSTGTHSVMMMYSMIRDNFDLSLQPINAIDPLSIIGSPGVLNVSLAGAPQQNYVRPVFAENPDGSISLTFSDGSVVTANSQGQLKVQLKSDGETVFESPIRGFNDVGLASPLLVNEPLTDGQLDDVFPNLILTGGQLEAFNSSVLPFLDLSRPVEGIGEGEYRIPVSLPQNLVAYDVTYDNGNLVLETGVTAGVSLSDVFFLGGSQYIKEHQPTLEGFRFFHPDGSAIVTIKSADQEGEIVIAPDGSQSVEGTSALGIHSTRYTYADQSFYNEQDGSGTPHTINWVWSNAGNPFASTAGMTIEPSGWSGNADVGGQAVSFSGSVQGDELHFTGIDFAGNQSRLDLEEGTATREFQNEHGFSSYQESRSLAAPNQTWSYEYTALDGWGWSETHTTDGFSQEQINPAGENWSWGAGTNGFAAWSFNGQGGHLEGRATFDGVVFHFFLIQADADGNPFETEVPWGYTGGLSTSGFDQQLRIAPIDNFQPYIKQTPLELARDSERSLTGIAEVTDLDGDSITAYQVRQVLTRTDGAYFELGGQRVASDTTVEFSAANVTSAVLHGGAERGIDEFWIRASDGTDWSAWTPILLRTGTLEAPVVQQEQSSIFRGDATTLSDFFSVTDPEGDDVAMLEFRDLNGAAGSAYLSFDGYQIADQEVISVSPAVFPQLQLFAGSQVGVVDTIQVRAFDGESWSDWASLNITTREYNWQPTLANQIASQDFSQGQAVNFTFAGNTFVDPNAGDTLTYSAAQANGTALPVWLAFDPASRTFSGSADQAGSFDIRVTATDGGGRSNSDVFSLTVSGNQAPVANPDAVNVTEDSTSANLVPALLANDTDPNAGDTKRITAVGTTGTVGTVVFNAVAQTLTYSADAAAQDALGAGATSTDTFNYTVSDGAGLTSSTTVTVTLTGANDAPVLVTPIADQTATEDAAFSFTVSNNAFADVDVGDTLTYGATRADGTALPTWLTFDAATRTLSGTPSAADTGNFGIRVTATDQGGLSTSDSFALNVVPANAITGTSSSDTLIGTDGVDVVLGLDGGDIIVGNGGNDVISGGAGDDNLDGGAGDDTFLVQGSEDGNDGVEGGAGFDQIVGGSGDDVIGLWDHQGTRTVERIDGGAGVNVISGTPGFDNLDFSGTALLNIARIEGGDGGDNIVGSAGNDVIVGGLGDDNLDGGAGDDTFLVQGSEDGTDAVQGGEGFDQILGGSGDDVIGLWDYQGTRTVERIDGGAGVNIISSTGGSDSLDFSATTLVNITRIEGGEGADRITGSAGNDTLDGGADDNDVLAGGTGDDTYLLGRGYGADDIEDNDSTAGNTDIGQFLAGVSADQIWFQQTGDDLVASIVGTSDRFTVRNWYLDSDNHLEEFRTADGSTLLDSNVQNLVNAMAAFAPPAPGQETLPSDYAAALNPVIAANWQ